MLAVSLAPPSRSSPSLDTGQSGRRRIPADHVPRQSNASMGSGPIGTLLRRMARNGPDQQSDLGIGTR